MFTQADARWLSESALALYAAETVPEFALAATRALDARFNLLASACEELGPGGASYALHRLRSEVAAPRDHAAYLHDQPLQTHLASPEPPPLLHMRQLVSSDVWARTDHYNGIARPMGWRDSIHILGRKTPTRVLVGGFRKTAFTDIERDLMGHLQPHIASALQRAYQPTDSRPQLDKARIELSAQLRPRPLSRAQVKILTAYFPHWRNTNALPAELQTWIAHSLRQLLEQPPPSLRSFRAMSIRGTMLFRCFPATASKPAHLHLVEMLAAPDFSQLRGHGLTERECEILHWIALGKRDAEIAAIAGCKTRTVNKHVGNLLGKFGVANRVACVAAAQVRLRDARD